MLGIAVPNGIESGVFQLTKVALSSIVALFGTCQIAANGVAQSIWSLAALAGVAMGPVFITVIGQCMGGGNPQAAEDVKFTMYLSLFTTVAVRLVLSVVFAVWLDWGVLGIAAAMCCDWSVKGAAQYARLKNGKWKSFRLV